MNTVPNKCTKSVFDQDTETNRGADSEATALLDVTAPQCGRTSGRSLGVSADVASTRAVAGARRDVVRAEEGCGTPRTIAMPVSLTARPGPRRLRSARRRRASPFVPRVEPSSSFADDESSEWLSEWGEAPRGAHETDGPGWRGGGKRPIACRRKRTQRRREPLPVAVVPPGSSPSVGVAAVEAALRGWLTRNRALHEPKRITLIKMLGTGLVDEPATSARRMRPRRARIAKTAMTAMTAKTSFESSDSVRQRHPARCERATGGRARDFSGPAVRRGGPRRLRAASGGEARGVHPQAHAPRNAPTTRRRRRSARSAATACGTAWRRTRGTRTRATRTRRRGTKA